MWRDSGRMGVEKESAVLVKVSGMWTAGTVGKVVCKCAELCLICGLEGG